MPEAVRKSADLINSYSDRFLFGADEVAPPDQQNYLRIHYQYDPLWKLLNEEANQKVRKGNYERIFDDARRRVREWEKAHAQVNQGAALYDPIATGNYYRTEHTIKASYDSTFICRSFIRGTWRRTSCACTGMASLRQAPG
jgi:hypothetical protein